MKKLTKILAAAMALSLVLGMTVNAASSTSSSNTDINNDVLADQAEKAAAESGATFVNASGEVLSVQPTITPVTVAVVDKAAEEATAQVKDAKSTKVVAALDVFVDLKEIGAEKATVKLAVPAVVAGKNYVVLHEKSAGVWEVITPDAIENGYITATFTSFSNVAIVEVEKKEAPASKPSKPSSKPAAEPAAEDVSPKTGEAMPVAGLLAVICLAGVAVSAKKIRYSK